MRADCGELDKLEYLESFTSWLARIRPRWRPHVVVICGTAPFVWNSGHCRGSPCALRTFKLPCELRLLELGRAGPGRLLVTSSATMTLTLPSYHLFAARRTFRLQGPTDTNLTHLLTHACVAPARATVVPC